jgi:hypothetical protein
MVLPEYDVTMSSFLYDFGPMAFSAMQRIAAT